MSILPAIVARAWPLAALACSACGGWPLYADLPAPDPGAVPAPDDPRALVEVDWTTAAEGESNDDPTAREAVAALPDQGLVIAGTLQGTGWYDEATPHLFESADCDSEGPRAPFDEGDYLGDVDYFLLDAPDGGQLCAEVATGASDVGWDLLLVEVDSCGVPVSFAAGDDDPLGFGLGGTRGGWTRVVRPGTSWAVQLAGYYPNDLEREVDYTLGLSVIVPGEDGEPGPCPLLPDPEEAR